MKFIATVSALALLMSQVTATPAAGCLQNHTITATDSCTSVAAQFQITEAEFYAMNPGLHHSVAHDCDNLDNGKPFCVCMTSPCPVKEAAAPAVTSVLVTTSAGAVATTGVASPLSSAAAASAAASVVASVSAAASSMASMASSAVSMASSAPSVAASATPASSGAAGKAILGAMTAAFVVAATSALL